MPVAFMFSAKDVDQSLYEVAMKGIGREAIDAPTPAGFLAHLAGPNPEGGWRVVDVWESEDSANAFYGSEQFQKGVVEALPAIDVTPWPLQRIELDRALRSKD